MTTYKIRINSKDYSTYEVLNVSTLENTEIIVNPIENKLFNDDIFELDKDGKITIQHSSIRSMSNIPGVLVLNSKKTYGKIKNKFLYKLIPDDKNLPDFLVAHINKIKFNKKLINKYVLFKFKNWDDKHPIGQLEQVLGSVNNLDNFYEYQLYCKNLYASIRDFRKKTLQKLKKRSEKELVETIIDKYKPVDRRIWDVYSIDPKRSKDFDDAFSYKETQNHVYLSIYISNVSLWIDMLGLWDSFSERISTIYLPNRKCPMLPTILSDSMCSLQENHTRFAFTLDLKFDKNYNLLEYKHLNTSIIVKRNFRYEERDLLKLDLYKKMFKFIDMLNVKEKYTENIKNSHDLIEYIMIYMNYISSKEMIKNKVGIFRSAELKKDLECSEATDPDIKKFLKQWNSSGGQYLKFEEKKGHEILGLDSYIHVTSPIRRLVDLLNIIILQNELTEKNELTELTENSQRFLSYWTSDVKFEYINRTMKAIRKVQNNCELLRICVEEEENKIYNGFIFDKIEIKDGLYQYMIYLQEIKMVNRLTSICEKDSLTFDKFKLFTFIDESNLKQKIRVEFK